MNWKYKFTARQLDSGQNLYNSGSIDEYYKDSTGKIIVYVRDRYYDNKVTVYLDSKGQFMDCKCSCLYGRRGDYCYHDAAALMFLEDEHPELIGLVRVAPKIVREVVKPFEGMFDEGYYYFDMEKITKDVTFYKDTVEKARELIENGTVTVDRANFNPSYLDDGYTGYLTGKILEDNGTYRNNRFDFTKNMLGAISCHCPNCLSKYGYYNTPKLNDLCVNSIATILLTADYIKENNPGDFTNEIGREFMENFIVDDNEELIDLSERENNVSLEPRVSFGYDNKLRVSFKIGTDKMFIVKGFKELVNAVDNGKVLTLGKYNKIDFSREYFNEESMQYYKMIEESVADQSSSRDYYNYEKSSTNTDLVIKSSKLDDFFESCLDKRIEDISPRREKPYTMFLEGSPEIVLNVDKNEVDGVFEGVTVSGYIPEFIRGNKNIYFHENGNLYRVTSDKQKAIKKLSKLSRNDLKMRIGRKNLPDFYRHLLPYLRDNFTVIENDLNEIEQYLPKEAIINFYFDIDDMVASVKTTVSYGDEVKTLFVDKPIETYRDLKKENKAIELIEQYLPVIDGQDNSIHYSDGLEDSVYDLYQEGLDEFKKIGIVNVTEKFKKINVRKNIKVKVGVSVENNLLDLTISSDDVSTEELIKILSSYQTKKKFYRLKNGDFFKVDSTDVASLDDMMKDLNVPLKSFVEGKMQVPAYRALYLDKLLEEKENMYANRDNRYKQLLKDFKTIDDSMYEVPDSLDKIMREYQKTGYKWLKTLDHYRFGGILADDMGLGKTLQVISLLVDEKQQNGKATSLVVCPASLVYNWENEFKKFASDFKVGIIAGSAAERKELIKKCDEYDAIITSYDLLKRDVAEYSDKTFRYQIIDEAQYIKTASTSAAKSAKVINAETKLALTGTPIENRLSELWSIFDYLMPGFLFSYDNFKKHFEKDITKYGDVDATGRLKKMIAPFFLRRRKSDVLKDLPDKIEEVTLVKFDDKQQKLYDGQVLKMTKQIAGQSNEAFSHNKIAILAELTRIRQICCAPELVFENYDDGNAKLDACLELVNSAIESGHKILLFSQFTSMLDIIAKRFDDSNISYYMLTGETKKEERIRLVDNFNKDETRVFLISLKAGGTGLNLTGADIVIHYDPWWNLAAQNQATDRTHRIGQDKVVTVFKLIAQGSIEEKIVELQNRKKDLSDALLEGENGNLSSLSKDDLLQILTSK